jgi:fumarate reductase flavoprotein subunit
MQPREQGRLSADIVVIGAGGGGLAAAVAASEKGSDVIVLEKRPTFGGNSSLAFGLFGAESPVQKRMGIEAGKDGLFKAAIGYAHWKTDPKIVRAFINRSGDTIRWLEEKSVEFLEVTRYYPHPAGQNFHHPKGDGAGLMKLFVRECEHLKTPILYNSAARHILKGTEGAIEGVIVGEDGNEMRISSKAVIIATGGYAGNKELLKKLCPSYTEDIFLRGLPHTGDGLAMATEVGAATEGLGVLQLRGPFFQGSRTVGVAAIEPNVIWVNKNGERFVDETTAFYWPESANALDRQPGKICFSLFDERIKKRFMENGVVKGYTTFSPGTKLDRLEKELESEMMKGAVKISKSWEEIAAWMGASVETLQSTVNEYNSSCDTGYDEPFLKERRFLMPLRTPPFYAVMCHQAFLDTIGGIRINHRMEVVTDHDRPIPGLYAAGVDTGGWESDTYCIILAGATLGFAINSGRIAGENAAVYASALHHPVSGQNVTVPR